MPRLELELPDQIAGALERLARRDGTTPARVAERILWQYFAAAVALQAFTEAWQALTRPARVKEPPRVDPLPDNVIGFPPRS